MLDGYDNRGGNLAYLTELKKLPYRIISSREMELNLVANLYPLYARPPSNLPKALLNDLPYLLSRPSALCSVGYEY